MKPPKIFLALLILLILCQICLAQEKSGEAFDSFGAIGCDDFRGRIDNFFVALKNNPDAVGYFVIYGSKNPAQYARWEGRIRGHIKLRRFPVNRVKFILATSADDLKIEFWLSRNGEKPVSDEMVLNLTLKSGNNRYLFAHDAVEVLKQGGKLIYSVGFESFCQETFNLSLLAKYLDANPEMNAEIFVFNRKKSRAEQFIKLFLKEAADEYKISPERLKISYSGIPDDEFIENYHRISVVKIWLVAKREKK